MKGMLLYLNHVNFFKIEKKRITDKNKLQKFYEL